MNISKFIQELRRKQKISQEALAKHLGLTRQTFAAIEDGKRELTISEATKLAGFFDLTLFDFLLEKKESFEVILEKGKKIAPKKPKMRDDRPQITVDPSRVEKFKQVFLYILEKVGAKPHVGESVIYKLLYFIDFDYYEKYEEQLIGATYIKNHFGPTPVEFKKIVREMEKDKEVKMIEDKYFKFPQRKYLPTKEPDLSKLTGRELKHIDEVLFKLGSKNASELRDYSHEDVPWIGAKEGEPMSYEAVFYRMPKTSVRKY